MYVINLSIFVVYKLGYINLFPKHLSTPDDAVMTILAKHKLILKFSLIYMVIILNYDKLYRLRIYVSIQIHDKCRLFVDSNI